MSTDWVSGRLGKGEFQRYAIDLSADEAVDLTVDQQGVDLLVVLEDSAGRQLLVVDRPIGRWGPERLCWVAKSSGRYIVHIRPLAAEATGPYRIRLESRRHSEPTDRVCDETLRAMHSALADQVGTREPALRKAAATWLQLGASFDAAILVRQLGHDFLRRGRLAEAREQFEKAARWFRLERQPHAEAQALVDLARVAAMQVELDEARAAIDTALELARRGGYSDAEAAAWTQLAVLESTLGNGHKAADHLRKVRSLWRANGHREGEATALFYLGRTLSEDIGYFPQAADAFQEALRLWPVAEAPDQHAATRVGLGWALHRQGRSREAIEHFLEAAKQSRRAGHKMNEAAALDRLGSAYQALGESAEAGRAFRRSLQLSREGGNLLNEAHTRTNLGWWWIEEGVLGAARKEFQLALPLLEQAADRDALAHNLAGLATVAKRRGDFATARRLMERVFQEVESVRTSATASGAILKPDRIWRQYDQKYFDLLLASGDSDQLAFEVCEHARSRNLDQILREAEIDLRSTVSPDLLKREQDLLGRERAIERALRELPRTSTSAIAVERLQSAWQAIRLAQDDLRRSLRLAHPRLGILGATHAQIRLPDVQNLLDDTTWLLSYCFGETSSALFVIGPSRFETYRLAQRKDIEKMVELVLTGWSDFSRRRAERQTQLVVEALSEQLLGPLRKQTLPARLVIATDGALSKIPFSAIPLPDKQALVLDRHDVVYTPSAKVSQVLRGRRHRHYGKTIAVVADPVFSLLDPRFGDTQSSTSGTFSRLPYSRAEAEAILGMISESQRIAALGFAANRRFLTSGSLQQFSIVHLATHAVIDEQRPGSSGLLLSLWDAQGRRADGELRLQEIYTLQLGADLVVLSACRTSGRSDHGDGLLGFTGAFFYAGARRLVASLWDVDDQATSMLMAEFYQGLFEKELSPSAALRRAKTKIRELERWQHPYYWAGMTFQGDWDPG